MSGKMRRCFKGCGALVLWLCLPIIVTVFYLLSNGYAYAQNDLETIKQQEIQKAIEGGYTVTFEGDPKEYGREEMEKNSGINQAIQKAKDGGYTIFVNGQEVGNEEALKRHQEYNEKMEGLIYEDELGNTTTFYDGDAGKHVTKEQFIEGQEKFNTKMQRELGEHYKHVKETASKEQAERERKEVEKSKKFFEENLVKEKEKVKDLKPKPVGKTLISE